MTNFTCVFCNLAFDEARLYQRHINKDHTDQSNYDQEMVKNELDKLSVLQDKKKFICVTCEKAFTRKSGLQAHICKESKSKVAKIIDAEVTDYESALKLREYVNKVVDKYDDKKAVSVINNNINNTINNNNIFNINVYTLAKIDMSDVINNRFIKDLCNQISKPLMDMREIDYKISVHENNHMGRKNEDYHLQLKRFNGQKDPKLKLARKTLIIKMMETFTDAYFSNSNPSRHIIYVTSDRSSEQFYVRDGSGWNKNGDDATLTILLTNIYDKIIDRIKLLGKQQINNLIEDFYHENYNEVAPQLIIKMRQRAFELREVVKPTYEATKHMTIDMMIKTDESDDDSFPDIPEEEYERYSIVQKPTYTLRTQEEADREDREKYGYVTPLPTKSSVSSSSNNNNNYDDNGGSIIDIQESDDYDRSIGLTAEYVPSNKDDEDSNLSEDAINENDLKMSKDGREFYEDTYKSRKIFVVYDTTGNAYEKKGPISKIGRYSSDELRLIGKRYRKNKYMFFEEADDIFYNKKK